MHRLCDRPDCHHVATATLSYNYHDKVVWLDELTPEAHPMTHDLCIKHADDLRPPYGWTLNDQRRRLGVAIGEIIALTA